MPAVRQVTMTHPQTAEVGLWLELSTDPVGTLTGLARTAFPSTAGFTLAQYQSLLTTAIQNLCNLPGQTNNLTFGAQPPAGWLISGNQLIPMLVKISLTLSSLTPVTISNVTVSEGAVRHTKIGGARWQ